jgi:hypothetical protein
MRTFLTLIFLIFFQVIARADYRYMSLSTLVCEADYGDIGRIVKLDKNYFYLKVEEHVLGEKMKCDTLKIQRFEDWNCGRRYNKYKIGQKELVFYRKSNYVIDDYDLLGYGGGGEFELPIRNDSIFYNSSYRALSPYKLKHFVKAVKDFNTIKQRTKARSVTISKEEQRQFGDISALHKLFIECKSYRSKKEFEIPTEGYMVNLESNYLYKEYENKIYMSGMNMDSIQLSVEDADVWKQDQYFVVKPKDGWTSRWLNVYAENDTIREKSILSQIFEVIELPEPRIYFGDNYRDTISRYETMPSAKHYLDDMHHNRNLNYELLTYTYEIVSKGHIETFKIKSAQGTNELNRRLYGLQPGDRVTIKDVYVLYPNNTVRQIGERTVYVGKVD